VYDGLSRGKKKITGLAVGLPAHLVVEVTMDSPIVQFVCDPAVTLKSMEEHTELSVQFLDILGSM
jgi:hypothetical protein